MTKREIWIIAGAVVLIALIVIAIFVGLWMHGNSNPGTAGSTTQTPVPSSSQALSATNSSSPVASVPANVVVPDKGATGTPANVAVPAVQAAGDPSGSVSYRSFNISIQGGKYVPDTVIVKQGDTVNLELKAVDANYGFTQSNYGFNGVIAKGKTTMVQFQALQSGDFIFYCQSCGGPSKGPVGHIIVTAN